MMEKVFGSFATGRAAWGLLAVRAVMGSALALHGLQKIGNPFGWMGEGAPVPGFLQFLAFVSEFGGGLALVLGVLSPLAALGVAATMAVAVIMGHGADPFVAAPGEASKEAAAGYFAFAVLMLLNGPGALSIDALLFGKKRKQAEQKVASPATSTTAQAVR